MPDLVESMASFGKTWHRRETLVERPQTWEEMLSVSGIDWNVGLQPVHAKVGKKMIEIPDFNAVVRLTDKKPLGVVGSKYKPIQNRDAGQFLDELPLIGAMEYHTAGSLRGGKTIFVLGKLTGQDFEPLPGDLTECYVLATNNHDGTGSFRVLTTTVRVVCANTLNLALTRAGKSGLAIRHVGNPKAKLDEARRVLGFATEEIQRYQELCGFLSTLKVNKKQSEQFIANLLPGKKDDKGKEIVSGKLKVQRDTIAKLAEEGMGTDIAGVRGTKYGLLQAVTEYTSHHMTVRGGGKDKEKRDALRQAGAWFGAGDRMNQRAQKLLVDA